MKKSDLVLLIVVLLSALAAVGVWVDSHIGLRVPNFGQGYVITDTGTNKEYQLRGRESFRIEGSTIEFVPCNSPDASTAINSNWELRPGLSNNRD